MFDKEREVVGGEVASSAEEDEDPPATPKTLHSPAQPTLDTAPGARGESVLALDLQCQALARPALATLSQHCQWVSDVCCLVEKHDAKLSFSREAAHHQVPGGGAQEVPLTPGVHPHRVLQQEDKAWRHPPCQAEGRSTEVDSLCTAAPEVRVGEHDLARAPALAERGLASRHQLRGGQRREDTIAQPQEVLTEARGGVIAEEGGEW